MKRILSLVLLVVLFVLCAADSGIRAETRYVSENFEITLRTGPSVENKIISLIRSGTSVEVLDAGEEWCKVVYKDKTGWVLSRYLIAEEPCAVTFPRLKERYAVLKKQTDELLQKSNDLEAENKRLQSALAAHRNSLEQVGSDYEKLKKESADFLELKAAHDKAGKELAISKARLEQAEVEIRQLLKDQNIKWFMVGAGVLILGFIIGFSSRRQRRQSSLLG